MSPSMFSLFTAGLAALAPLAAAYTTPTGDAPKGNPISQPGLNTIVPVDESFTITWDPTTEGTVSLILLKGPAENLQFITAIAEKVANSGSYTWTPADTLEASQGAMGYGIQLIDDATGQYQYTTQFGISNDAVSSSVAAGPSSYAAAPSSYAAVSSAVSSAASEETAATTSYACNPAHAYPNGAQCVSTAGSLTLVTPASTATSAVVAPVVTPAAPYSIPNNTTAPYASGVAGSMSTRVASPTGGNTTSVEPSSGGASGMAASFGGLVIAAAVAVFAL